MRVVPEGLRTLDARGDFERAPTGQRSRQPWRRFAKNSSEFREREAFAEKIPVDRRKSRRFIFAVPSNREFCSYSPAEGDSVTLTTRSAGNIRGEILEFAIGIPDTLRFQDAEKYAAYLKTPAGRLRSELALGELATASCHATMQRNIVRSTWAVARALHEYAAARAAGPRGRAARQFRGDAPDRTPRRARLRCNGANFLPPCRDWPIA